MQQDPQEANPGETASPSRAERRASAARKRGKHAHGTAAQTSSHDYSGAPAARAACDLQPTTTSPAGRHGDRGNDDGDGDGEGAGGLSLADRRPVAHDLRRPGHRPTKTYLRKAQVAQRYGFHERSIDRWVAQAKLPQPTLFLGRWPLWDEAELDAHDLALANAVRSKHDEATSDHV